jgi:hypothetical protein
MSINLLRVKVKGTAIPLRGHGICDHCSCAHPLPTGKGDCPIKKGTVGERPSNWVRNVPTRYARPHRCRVEKQQFVDMSRVTKTILQNRGRNLREKCFFSAAVLLSSFYLISVPAAGQVKGNSPGEILAYNPIIFRLGGSQKKCSALAEASLNNLGFYPTGDIAPGTIHPYQSIPVRIERSQQLIEVVGYKQVSKQTVSITCLEDGWAVMLSNLGYFQGSGKVAESILKFADN